TVHLCDSLSDCAADQPFALTITNTVPGLHIVLPSFFLPQATTGITYLTRISAVGGTLPYAWCVLEQSGQCDNGTGGALPPGLQMLTVATQGNLPGVPSAAGTWRFTIRVTDATGTSAFWPTALVVQGGGPPPPPPGSFVLNGNFTLTGNSTLAAH